MSIKCDFCDKDGLTVIAQENLRIDWCGVEECKQKLLQKLNDYFTLVGREIRAERVRHSKE